jgi:hypothetical protein
MKKYILLLLAITFIGCHTHEDDDEIIELYFTETPAIFGNFNYTNGTDYSIYNSTPFTNNVTRRVQCSSPFRTEDLKRSYVKFTPNTVQYYYYNSRGQKRSEFQANVSNNLSLRNIFNERNSMTYYNPIWNNPTGCPTTVNHLNGDTNYSLKVFKLDKSNNVIAFTISGNGVSTLFVKQGHTFNIQDYW